SRHVLIVIELREIFGIRNERDKPVAALRRFADLDQLDAVAGRRHFLEVSERIVVRREIEIVSRLMPQHGLRRRHRGERADRREQQRNSSASFACLPSRALRERSGASFTQRAQSEPSQRRSHGITASLYCSSKSSIFDPLKSFVLRSTANFFNCVEYVACRRAVAASSTFRSSSSGMRSR